MPQISARETLQILFGSRSLAALLTQRPLLRASSLLQRRVADEQLVQKVLVADAVGPRPGKLVDRGLGVEAAALNNEAGRQKSTRKKVYSEESPSVRMLILSGRNEEQSSSEKPKPSER